MKYIVIAMCLVMSSSSVMARNYFEPSGNSPIKREIKRQMEMEREKQDLRARGVTPGPLWEGNWGGSL